MTAPVKRLTLEALETLAYAKRKPIEIDDAQGIAALTIGNRQYYAVLPPKAVAS